MSLNPTKSNQDLKKGQNSSQMISRNYSVIIVLDMKL